MVASFTGAWIETGDTMEYLANLAVASFTGAWIETVCFWLVYSPALSHPLRVRGLKQGVQAKLDIIAMVASFTGAWIETVFRLLPTEQHESHPLRVRGLKHCNLSQLRRLPVSHPLRVRGLKPNPGL